MDRISRMKKESCSNSLLSNFFFWHFRPCQKEKLTLDYCVCETNLFAKKGSGVLSTSDDQCHRSR